MNVTNISDINSFFEVVDKCEGKVELITENGDQLNLKSKFNQYTALIILLEHAKNEQKRKLEIVAEQQKDEEKIMQFLR